MTGPETISQQVISLITNKLNKSYNDIEHFPEIKTTIESYKKYYSSLTPDQIRNAFDKGYSRQYGDNYGYKSDTFIRWLKAKQDELKTGGVYKPVPLINQFKEQPKKELTEEELYKSDVRFWNELRQMVKGHKQIITVSAAYDMLVRRKKLDPDKYKDFLLISEAEAKELLEKKLEGSASLSESREIKKAIENLMSGPDSKIISDAKMRSVVEYFNGVK